jgi:hypothetical protein
MINKQYIEMSEKAIEIQESYRSRNPTPDDIFVGKIYHGIELFGHLTPTNVPVTDDYIWLPRQEQLLEMIPPDWGEDSPITKMVYIVDWGTTDCSSAEYSESFKTMEQLLLAYIMSEKFKKVWDLDKKEWVVK